MVARRLLAENDPHDVVLEARRPRLEAIAAALLEKEYLEGDEFRAMLAK